MLKGKILNDPESTKVRIAVCCVDFLTKNLTAIEDEAYKRKLRNIENALTKLEHKPDLVVFPEGAGSPEVISLGRRLAKSMGAATVCGTRLDAESNTIVSDVICPDQEYIFEKEHLSPYDTELSDVPVRPGKSSGGQFYVRAKKKSGASVQIVCQLYICYDLHYWRLTSGAYVPLVVVPMFHPRWDMAQRYAVEIVKKNSSRVFLVNKNRSTLALGNSRIVGRDLSVAMCLSGNKILKQMCWTIFCFVDQFVSRFFSHWAPRKFFLASSAHGPMNRNDENKLRSIKDLSASARSRRIWMNFRERIVIGDYEVGIEATDGHENRFDTGFFYTGFLEVDFT
jgi:predicted amidohydrolase